MWVWSAWTGNHHLPGQNFEKLFSLVYFGWLESGKICLGPKINKNSRLTQICAQKQVIWNDFAKLLQSTVVWLCTLCGEFPQCKARICYIYDCASFPHPCLEIKNGKQREYEAEESCTVLCHSSPGSDWKLLWSQVLPAQALVQSTEKLRIVKMRKGSGNPFVNNNIRFMMSSRWHLIPKCQCVADFIE